MNIAVLFSGGKDSTFAAYWATLQGWDVSCLVSLKSKNPDSYMFHTPNIDLVHVQSEALGIPLILQETSGEKESELSDLSIALASARDRYGVSGVLVGAISSNYQEERVNRICHDLGLKVFTPLWHKDQAQLLSDMVSSGFEIILTHVSAEGLGMQHLGRRIDTDFVKELVMLSTKIGLNPAGEGGEFESLVLNGPLFKRRIRITVSEKIQESYQSALLKITGVELV